MNKKNLIKFLNDKYPLKSAEKWDFVGYSLKNNKVLDIKKILICLDVNQFSIEEAIKQKVNMIISFHPFLFAKKWEEVFEYDKSKKEQVKLLKKNNIEVFAIHTNFDKHKYGTKYWFNKKLGIEDKVIKSYEFSSIINYDKSFKSLVDLLKNKLDINLVMTNSTKNDKSKINNIYIQPGAGDIYFFLDILKKEKNIDLLITSDIKWNEQQLLNSLGINFLIIPHKTEDVFVDALANVIQKEFNEIKIEKFICKDFIRGV